MKKDISLQKIHFDAVFVDNNESEFISKARALGYSKILFITQSINYTLPEDIYSLSKLNHVDIMTGFLLHSESQINNARKRFDYVIAYADRKYFETKVDFIINSENSDRKDTFHYRSTSLNQVHAALARENNISIVFNFGGLLLESSNDGRKSNIISSRIKENFGRMVQNASLVNKYGLNHSAFSLATSPELMRSRAILDALDSILKL